MSETRIVEFIRNVPEIKKVEELTRHFEALVNSMGFRYFCVYQAPKPVENSASLLISANFDPHWAKRYIERKYIVIDPCNRFLVRANRSFSWQEALDAYRGTAPYRRMSLMMDDAAANGLVHGYIFPVFSRTGLLGATSVGGPDDVKLGPMEMELLETAFRMNFHRHVELFGGGLEAYVADGKDVMLTQREHQALNSMAEGLTSNEIAKLINVSPATVDWYMNQLQDKLGAKNRPHTATIAFRQGLIS